MSGKTIIDKIWNSHVVAQEPGHPAVFAIDLMLVHEVTSAQAFDTLREKGLRPCADTQFVATVFQPEKIGLKYMMMRLGIKWRLFATTARSLEFLFLTMRADIREWYT